MLLQSTGVFRQRQPSPPENHRADFPLGWAVTPCRVAAAVGIMVKSPPRQSGKPRRTANG
ncbi:MAG: hypothetical protein LBP75_11855 [Planctomycetota bacterium]|nr:hypothetical protein [Planctomycetota bacterium]